MTTSAPIRGRLAREPLIEQSPELWTLTGPDGYVKEINASFTRLLGWTAEDCARIPMLEMIHPEDRDLVRQHFYSLREGGSLRKIEVRVLCRDGSYRWVSWNACWLTGEDLIAGVGRDTTLERRQSRLLERSSVAARIGGWEVDCLSGELYWTEETFRIHETTPAEYTPDEATAIAFHTPESRPVITAAVQRGVERGEPWDLELDLITARGRRIVVRAIGEAERMDGRTTKLFGSFQDVTERKRARDEQARLESRVQQAQKLDSLGVLAGGVAHDFNNLLTGILGHTDLALMQMPPDSPARSSLDQVLTGATRAADLTRELLAYSGKGRFVVQPLDLSALIREMGELLHVSISKKVTLKYHLSARLPTVEADPTQLRQVAMNLILNASEAIGDRPGLLIVSTGVMRGTRGTLAGGYPDEDHAEGEYVYLGVADTGCGMSSEVLGRIFDPFFSTKFAGRGLGLAAVPGIVRGHKGVIKVQSDPGRGTTFWALFPAARSASPTAEEPAEAVRDWRGSGLILVVDDEEGVRGMAKAMLRRMGFSVLTAADGREGVEAFRRHADDVRLVLLDLTMPQVDGEAAFREMRLIRPNARVLLSSGFSEPEGAGRLTGEGLAGFIMKPYRYDQLVQAVRAAVEG